jgi:hypothetical protein
VLEQRLAAPGRGQLALRDLRLIDGALAELADALGLYVTSYDIGPAGERASGRSAAADGGEPDR